MKLKRQLNWAVYSIFTFFVIISLISQLIVMTQQIDDELVHHNQRLEFLVNQNLASEIIYDNLNADYIYHSFSIESSTAPYFQFLSEDLINLPIISLTLRGTNLLSEQQIVIGEQQIKYTLDLSSIMRHFQQMMLILLIVITASYILVTVIIKWIIGRYLSQPITEMTEKLTLMSKFVFSDEQINEQMIDEIKPLNLAIAKISATVSRKIAEIAKENKLLQQEAFTDELTGFGNRVVFNKDLKELLDPKQKIIHQGQLCFIHTLNLSHINKEQGFEEGNRYISKVSDLIRQSLKNNKQAKVYRVSGADFVVLLSNQTEVNTTIFASELKTHFDNYQKHLEVNNVAFVGVVSYRTGDQFSDTMANVDTAVSIAQTYQANSWHYLSVTENKDGIEWKETLDIILKNTNLNLSYQPIVPFHGDTPLYIEILARFYDQNNNDVSTQSLIAMSKRFNRAQDVDKLIINHVSNAITQGQLKGFIAGVKLTTSSVLSTDFASWIDHHLLLHPEIAHQIVFEISCTTVEQNSDYTQNLISILRRCGSKVALSNFGATPLSFRQLITLRPEFVKFDRSVTVDLLKNKDDQFYIRQLIDLTRQIRAKVIVVGIENDEERRFVDNLRIDGMQGYFISKPQNISNLV